MLLEEEEEEKEEGVNNSPPVIKKEGVPVLRMNEQADKLCEGSLRRERAAQGDAGADAVVFGKLNTLSHCSALTQSGWLDLVWSWVHFPEWSVASETFSSISPLPLCFCLLA